MKPTRPRGWKGEDMVNVAALEALARELPKAELHVHIEGTLEPELMVELAERNSIEIPFATAEDARAAYEFNNLQEFLDLYYAGMSVLVTREDFQDLTWAYLTRVAADGVAHVEVMFDPQGHTERGVPIEVAHGGIVDALRRGEAELGITWRLILCFLRHLPAEDGEEALAFAIAHQDTITAIGLDSSEVGNPPEKYADIFARARNAGLRAVAHAGEEGTADDVRRTLDVLGVDRIDHGVAALDDPSLVKRLVDGGIALTVCPLSNVKLKVFDSMDDHNLKEMLDLGVMATVNSDDPSYFGGYLLDNYVAAIRSLGLAADDVMRLARNSFTASYLDGAAKMSALIRVDATYDAWMHAQR